MGFGGEIKNSFNSIFMGIDGSKKKRFTSKTDGFMGLAPYTSLPDQKERNFMYQLKQNGYIDHIVFSAYLSMGYGNTTHIKFGAFDEEGLVGNDTS